MDASAAVQFGSLLREARRSQGLSQNELGAGTYSGSYISHLESGRRTATPQVIEFLTRRLGVSPLEWGVSPASDPAQLVAGDTIEDLLVAERAWSEHDWDAAIEHSTRAAAIAGSCWPMWCVSAPQQPWPGVITTSIPMRVSSRMVASLMAGFSTFCAHPVSRPTRPRRLPCAA